VEKAGEAIAPAAWVVQEAPAALVEKERAMPTTIKEAA
jgi:hypothetical protein